MSKLYLVVALAAAIVIVLTVATPPAVPVLLIHDVGTTHKPWDFWTIDSDKLDRLVALLVRRGLHTLSVSEIEKLLAGRLPRARAESAVVFTVDDGPASALLRTAPVLSRHGLSSIVFVVSEWTPPTALGPTEIGRLTATGHEIGSHGATHLSLAPPPHPRTKPPDDRRLELELAVSRRTLERSSSRPIVALAYPKGEFDERTKRAARKAGYRLAFTTDPGYLAPDTDPLEIPRFQMNWNTPIGDVEGYLDWPEHDRIRRTANWTVLLALAFAGAYLSRSAAGRAPSPS